MNNNALYYPYINIPESKWLLEKLLYWDKIVSIVPYQVVAYKKDLSPMMNKLIGAELVDLIQPRDYYDELKDFEKNFLEIAKNFKPLSNKTTRIHIEKLGSLAYELEKIEAINSEEYSYPWFDMNEELAFIFMKMLAIELSELSNLNATAITDELSLNIKKEIVRENVLSFSMPLPNTDDISIEKILKFKEENNHLIIGYRNRIETMTLNIINQEENTRQDRYLLEKSIFNEEIKELNEAISSSWKVKSEKLLVPIINAVGGYATGGSAGAVVGLTTSGSSSLLNSFNKNRNPLSYYTGMERNF